MPQFALSTEINDEDWDALFAICWQAFEDAPEIRAFYPGGLDPDQRKQNVSKFKAGASSRGPVKGYTAKITDLESGTITSYISGQIYDGPLGNIDGELATPPPPAKLPFISDPKEREWWEWYWNTGRSAMRERKELHVPYVYIQALCTAPDWQRCGAATILMDWAINELTAKFTIRRCVLTALPPPLKAGFYQRFGFEVIYTQELHDEKLFPGRWAPPIVIMMKDW